MLQTVYIFCFAIGFIFVVLSFVLGEIFDIFSADVGGHGPGPLSTSVLAMFVTGFGIGGYGALKLLAWGSSYSLFGALAAGIGCSGVTYGVIRLLYVSGEGSSEFRLEDVVGSEAQVTVPIPSGGGRGEVCFIAAKARQIASAVSADGGAIAKNRLVRIASTMGDTLVVEEPSGETRSGPREE